jgi:hypothetical protein
LNVRFDGVITHKLPTSREKFAMARTFLFVCVCGGPFQQDERTSKNFPFESFAQANTLGGGKIDAGNN